MTKHRIYTMPMISFRVSEELKRRMEELKHINWSEVLRKAILETLEREQGANLAKAVLINERIRKKPPKGWNSTKTIRFWREHRYGKASRG